MSGPLRAAVNVVLDRYHDDHNWAQWARQVLELAVHQEDRCPVYRSDCPLCAAYLAATSQHGGHAMAYPVLGESDMMSGELYTSIMVAFPMLPASEVTAAVRRMRADNTMYTDILNAEVDAEAAAEAEAGC